MERNSDIKLTNEEHNNLISLCEAIRDNKPQQFKKYLKKISHRSQFLLSQSVTIRARKNDPVQNGKITGDPLYFAIHYSRNEMKNELVAKGSDALATTKNLFQSIPAIIFDGDTIETTREHDLATVKEILKLVNQGDLQKLEALLKTVTIMPRFLALINARFGKPQYNFLIQAVRLNSSQITELLCKFGVKINYATPDKKITALHMACEKGSLDCVKILLDYGADINAQTVEGQTPLYIAAYYGFDEVVKYLCLKQADTTISNINNFNPLHIAVMQNKIESVEILIDYFSDLEIEGKSKLTLLMLAVENQHERLVEYLLEKKVNPDHSNNPEFTPLYLAADLGNLAIIESLLRYGADINLARKKDRSTPLMIACFRGHLHIVKFLLKTEKIIIEKNNNIENQSCLIAALFIENPSNQIPIMTKLCQYGFDPLQNDTICGISVLLYALKEKNEAVLHVLAYHISRNFLQGKSKINFNNFAINHTHREYSIDNYGPLLILQLLYKINYLAAAKIFIYYGANGDIPTLDGKYESINEWVRLSARPNQLQQASSITQSETFDFYQVFKSDTNQNVISGLKYLQLNGFTPEEITKLKESTEQIDENKQSFFKSNTDKKLHYWCNSLFKSSDETIYPITGTPNCYVYIATDNLSDCPEEFFEKLKNLDFKFNSGVVKKLKIADSEINVSFNLMINQQSFQTNLTHEIKFAQSKARILLFELIDKPTGGTLYIGAKYLKNGLHTKADLESLKQSSNLIFINTIAQENNITNVNKNKLSL